MNKLITIKTASFPNELAVAISFLEENEIPCFLKDENLVQMYAAATTQGVQLQVAEQDVERAIALLIEGGFATKEEYKEDDDWLTDFVTKAIDKITRKE